MSITIIAPRQIVSFSHLCWPRDVNAVNKLLGLLKVPNSQAEERSARPHPMLAGITKARYVLRQKQKGQKSSGLWLSQTYVLLGMLLIKMSLSIPLTSLIHPRNLYNSLDSLYHPKAFSSNSCHLYRFGLELHQAGFHLSRYVLNIRRVRGQL